MGDPIMVEMPGTGQLDRIGTQRGLAAQLAYTFGQVAVRHGAQLTLTDSGRPVAVPGVGTTFTPGRLQLAQPGDVGASAVRPTSCATAR